MKRTLVIILLAMILPIAMNAQGLGIGIKAGANFANQKISDINTKSITNFHGGAYINLMFSEKFGITPEVLYTGTGSKFNNIEVNTDYVAIPVMIRYKLFSLLHVEAGPQFSFLTKAKSDGTDIKDQLKNNDFGIAVGAGLHLPLSLNAGVRYIWGFTNIADASSLQFDEAKNRTFQIYVGWTILGEN